LILYGHHADLADGPEVLDRAADFVNRLGAVQWGSLAWIARTNFTLSQAGDTLLLGAAQGISAGTVVKVSAPADKAPGARG